jgi:nucleoside-diphosphate-sugar epimerase
MRVFVTGATGFLGSYLIRDLLARGHHVAVLLRPSSDTWRLADVLSDIQPVYGSLDAIAEMREPLRRFQPEVVAHLAWHGVAGALRNDPSQAENVANVVRLVDLCADVGVKAFVGAGSQAEYGPYERPIREDDAPHPTTLYGKAKLEAGMKGGQLACDRGMRYAWLRVFSTYGPKDAGYWLIPSLIKGIRARQRFPLTACEQTWGFLHARDAAAAFRVVLETPDSHGTFNLAAAEAPKLRDTVTAIRDIVDPSIALGFGEVPYRHDQVMVLHADTPRLTALGWSPRVSLDDGLRETVAWYAQQQ